MLDVPMPLTASWIAAATTTHVLNRPPAPAAATSVSVGCARLPAGEHRADAVAEVLIREERLHPQRERGGPRGRAGRPPPVRAADVAVVSLSSLARR